jgi:hypothetical protein
MSIYTDPTSGNSGAPPPDEFFQQAERFAGLNVPTIPIKLGTKVPAVRWHTYQRRLPPRRTLRRWFLQRGWGLAVVCGLALAVRDFDTTVAYERWAQQHATLARTLPTVRTRRGFHVYHRAEREHYAELPDGEYRGTSRCYCVAPPTPHPDGGRYTFCVPLVGPPPLIDPVSAGLLPPPSPRRRHSLIDCVNYLSPEVANSGVKEAIRRTQPTGYGQRHRRLFHLAVALKRLPGLADADAEEVLPLVQEWFRRALPNVRTKDWEESRRDFTVAWQHAKRTCGLERLSAWVFGIIPLGNPANRWEGDIFRLELACDELQQMAGFRPFPLSCRVVAGLLGVSHTAGAKLLNHFVEARILRRETAGTYKGLRAAEYLYLGPTFGEGLMEAITNGIGPGGPCRQLPDRG